MTTETRITGLLLDQPLPLPDGRDARDLRLPALYASLRGFCPGISATMGKTELLRKYAALLLDRARKRSAAVVPSPTVLHWAAQELAAPYLEQTR